jgi:hypothetical protein
MAVEIVTTRQSITIDGVADIAVTAIERDDVKGDYFRDITFFGEGDDGETTAPMVMTIRIRASAPDPLKITVPQDEF